MTIKAVLALDLKDGLGKDNKLPWPYNSADMKWFKETTKQTAVVMGRNTWDSLPKKPLSGRYNIVVSNTMRMTRGIEVVRLDILKSRLRIIEKSMPISIIGGAKLFNFCIDIIDELHISRIPGLYSCDTYLDSYANDFKLVERHNYYDKQLYIEKWVKT